MTTKLAPLESLVRVHGRGSLLSMLEKEALRIRPRLPDRLFVAQAKGRGPLLEEFVEFDRGKVADCLLRRRKLIKNGYYPPHDFKI